MRDAMVWKQARHKVILNPHGRIGLYAKFVRPCTSAYDFGHRLGVALRQIHKIFLTIVLPLPWRNKPPDRLSL